MACQGRKFHCMRVDQIRYILNLLLQQIFRHMDSDPNQEDKFAEETLQEEEVAEERQHEKNQKADELQEKKEEGEEKKDNENPYFTLSEDMKKYFVLQGNSVSLAPDFTTPFEARKTKHHYCTHYFGYCRDQYYSCDDCSYNRSGYTMCFCLACWVPELHIGHSFSKRNAYNEGAYCDCGRVTRIQKTSFCPNHGLIETENLESEITSEQKEKFIKFFSPFFNIFYYQIHQATGVDFHESLKPVLDELSKLIEGSAYYSRLTIQLLKSSCPYNPIYEVKEEGNILFELAAHFYCQQVETFLQHVMTDLQSSLELARMVHKSANILPSAHQNFMARADQFFDNLQLCLILIKQGIVFEPLKQTFSGWATIHPEALALMKFSLEDQLKKIKQQEYESQVQRDLKCFQTVCELDAINTNSEENGKYILKTIFTYFPKKQEAINYFLRNTYEEQEKQKIKYQMTDVLPSGFQSSINTILRFIGDYCSYEGPKLSKFSEILENEQKERFSSFLFFATQQTDRMLFNFDDSYDKKKIATFGVYIALVNASTEKNQLIAVLQKFIKSQPFEDTLPEDVFSKIYSLICYLVNYEEFMITAKMVSKINSLHGNKRQVKKYYTKADEEFLRKIFHSYLYEKQSIPHSYLEERRGQGLLEFEDAGKILNSLCIYDDEDEYFKYTSNEKYPRSSKNFPSLNEEVEIEDSVVQNPTNLSTKFQFMDEVKGFASAFFNSFIDQLWSYEKLLKGDQIQTNQTYTGRLFLLIMIMADKFTEGQNQKIQKHLYDIQKGSPEWKIYTSGGDYSEAVSRALLMKNEESPEKREMEEEINDYNVEEDLKLAEMKKKKQEKKEKMLEKYKKTRVGVLQRMASKSESLQNADEDDDECLVCHQRKKKDNPLVYLAHAKMDNAISSAIHSGENKSNFLITTCFHTIHIQCFIKFEKESNMNFNCPLCSKRINCILPKQFNTEARKTNKICSNALIASLIVQYQCYDAGSSFSLLFKHIIESRGLNTLTSFSRYESEKKVWEKNDLFIEKIMDEIYTGSSEEERNLFDKEYKQFLLELELCKKRVYYLLQYLFAKAIHCKLNLEDFEEKQKIAQLSSRLLSDQFAMIKQNLSKLTGEEIVVDETAYKQEEGQEKESLAFNMVRPPAASTEFKGLIMKKCEECKDKEICYSKCLMCGAILCEDCHDSENHPQVKHNNIKLFLMLNDGAVSYETKNDSDWVSVYFNEFRTSYNDRESYIMSKNDVFYLDEIKLNKVMFSFMNSS